MKRSQRGPIILVSARQRTFPLPGLDITGDNRDFFQIPPFLRQGASQTSVSGVQAGRLGFLPYPSGSEKTSTGNRAENDTRPDNENVVSRRDSEPSSSGPFLPVAKAPRGFCLSVTAPAHLLGWTADPPHGADELIN